MDRTIKMRYQIPNAKFPYVIARSKGFVVKLHEEECIPWQDPLPSRKSKDFLLRLFSRRHAARYHFGSLSDLARIPLSHAIITADSRIIYIKNSKAGCSTVAHLLYQYDNGNLYNGNIHRAPVRLLIDDWGGAMRIPKNAFSFSTVRNPERRSVSAFFDFFIDKKNLGAPKHLALIDKFGFSRSSDIHYKFDVFIDYITTSFEHSVLRTDRHFRPQHVNLGNGAIELSYVSKLENLDSDLRLISDKLEVTLPQLEMLPKLTRNKSSSECFTPNPSQIKKIEVLYRKDYELYGY